MQNTDIIVVGSGFLGIYTALLLSEKGFSVTLATEGKNPLETLLHSLGVMWPSLNDPPTRAHVAHGHDMATYLNDFCKQGVDFFQAHYSTKDWASSTCLRVGLQNFEQEELEKAQQLGFSLQATSQKGIFLEEHSALICKNPLSFQKYILQLLQKNGVNFIPDKIVALQEFQNECHVNFQNHSEPLKSEVVVLANGVSIAELLPKYKPILVPMSDVLLEYECASSKTCEPLAFRASNGHLAVSLFSQEGKAYLKVSGPRFLLPQAGVGLVLKKEVITPQILNSLTKFHSQVFSILSQYFHYPSTEDFLQDFPFAQTNYGVFVDCHPCDELPLVGEFGKLGKVLGCTGFLATGFSTGVWGAKIICDLICNQKSENLHARLQPRRFHKIM